MKSKVFIGLALIVLFAFKQPCKKTEIGKGYRKGHIIVRTYPNCEDSLNYFYKELLPDSSVVAEGKVFNNERQGEWIWYYPSYINVSVYERGTLIKYIDKDTSSTLTDSLV